MDPNTVNLLLQLAAMAAKLAIEVKQQSGLTDEQLLDAAEKNGAAVRAQVSAFLETLK